MISSSVVAYSFRLLVFWLVKKAGLFSLKYNRGEVNSELKINLLNWLQERMQRLGKCFCSGERFLNLAACFENIMSK